MRSLLAAFLVSAAAAAQSQTIPEGFDLVAGTSTASSPFANSNDEKWHWVYDTRHFALQGCIRITEISVRAYFSASQPTVNAFNFGNVTVTLAYAANNYAYANYSTTFLSNMLNPVVVRTGAYIGGPYTTTSPNTGAWVPLGLTTPFDYDPSLGLDLVVQIEKCGTVAHFGRLLDLGIGSVGGLGAMRYGITSSCNSATWNTTQINPVNESAPILKLDYQPNFGGCPTTLGEYQTNHYGASMAIDRAADPGTMAPMAYARYGGEFGLLSMQAGLAQTGLPFEILYTPGTASVPASQGVLHLPGGQKLNLDPAAALWAFGGAAPASSVLFPGAVEWPFALPAVSAPSTFAFQAVITDPVMPGGFSLSHVQDVTVAPPPGGIIVEAVGASDRVASPSRGFWRVLHLGPAAPTPRDPITRIVFDWQGANVGAQTTRYFDVSYAGHGGRLDAGQSDIPGCRGTFRLESDAYCGLDFTNTPPSPCNPTASSGITPTNPHTTFPTNLWFQTLEFRFIPQAFVNKTFAFDANAFQNGTFGQATSGAGMAGMRVTVDTVGPGGLTTYQGYLAVDPSTLNRSFVAF